MISVQAKTSTLCPRYRDSPVIGDPLQSSLTGLLVIQTKCFFCPDNEYPVNEDFPKSSLSGQVLFSLVNGCLVNGD